MAKTKQAAAKKAPAGTRKSAKPAGKARTPLAVVPHLTVRDAAKALAFYKEAFAAKELSRMTAPNSKAIAYAEMRIGDFPIYLNDEFPNEGIQAPPAYGGTAVMIHLFVEDADAAFATALRAGAKVVTPLADQFWGGRYGVLEDPFGHRWSIGAAIESATKTPKQRRAAKFNAENPDWPKKQRA